MDPDRALSVRSGPWSPAEIQAFLDDASIPIRLATAGSYPMVQSLWFLREGEALWCATQATAVVARRLSADDRCGFEVAADAPPYRGVRGTGRVTLDAAEAHRVLPLLIAKYLGPEPTALSARLLAGLENEVAIRIDHLCVSTWDYTARMTAP